MLAEEREGGGVKHIAPSDETQVDKKEQTKEDGGDTVPEWMLTLMDASGVPTRDWPCTAGVSG